MTVTLDLELHAPVSSATATILGNEAEVRASSIDAATLSNARAVLKIIGSGEVVLR
jgi:hypothetical protein